MAATVGELNVKLNLEIQRLDAQIAQANAKVARMSKSMKGDFVKAARGINTALATIGLGVSVGGIVSFTKSVIELGSKITDLAATAGLSTDAFQTFRNVGLSEGVAMEQITNAFVKQRRAIEESIRGQKEYTRAFHDLGLSAEGLKQLAPERQFELVARAVSNADDKQKAINAAMKIFGEDIGPKLILTLNKIATEGYDNLAESMKGATLTEEQLQRLDRYADVTAEVLMKAKMKWAEFILWLDQQSNFSGLTPTMSKEEQLANAPGDGFGVVVGPVSSVPVSFDGIEGIEKQQQAIAETAKLREYEAEIYKATIEMEKQDEAAKKRLADADAKYNATLAKKDEEMRNVAERTRELIDPTKRLKDEIKAIEEAEAYGTLRHEEAAAAIEKIRKQIKDGGAIDAAKELGMTFSSAFEDAIVSGEKFSDVLRGLAQDILRIFARKNLTEPLANWLSSAFSGGGSSSGSSGIGGLIGSIFGGMFADGGRPPLGKVSLVGEAGPELFVPDAAGAIVSNDRIAEAVGSGGRESFAVTVVQQFAAGVSQSQLLEGLRQTKAAAEAGVMASISRRKNGFSAVALS